jgi:hypothetical protein
MGILIPQLAPASEDRVSGAQVVDGSLNFDSGSTNYLNRTPGSASNRRTWTASFWTKSSPSGSTQQTFIQCRVSANTDDTGIGLENDKIRVVTGAADAYTTKRVLRDPAGWYHVVVVFDTTQTTDSERVKIYVNGELDTGGATSYPSQNTEWSINTTSLHAIGRHEGADTQYLNSKLSQFYLIDGLTLGPGYFGYTDPLTNTWRPKKFRAQGTTVNDGTQWSSGGGSGLYSGSTWGPLFDGTPATDGSDIAQSPYVTNNGTSTVTFPKPISGILRFRACQGSNSTSSGDGRPYVTLSDGQEIRVDGANNSPSSHSFGYVSGITSVTINGTSAQGINLLFLQVDGVLMIDSTTTNLDFGTNGFYLPMDGNTLIGQDKSKLNPVNNGMVWSSKVTGANNPANAFDGSLSSNMDNNGSAGTPIVLTASFTNVTSFRYYTSNSSAHDVSFSGGSATTDAASAGWRTVSAPSSITSISWIHSNEPAAYVVIEAIEINGVVLKDNMYGNGWTPVNFGGSVALPKATGALPILNTDGGGNVARAGVRPVAEGFPNAGANDGTVWSDTTNTALTFADGYRAIFDGQLDTRGGHPAGSNLNTYVTITDGCSIPVSTGIRIYWNMVGAGQRYIRINGSTELDDGSGELTPGWSSVSSFSGTINKIEVKTAATSSWALAAVEVDGVILVDGLGLVLALPLVSTSSDVSNSVNSRSTTKVITATNSVASSVVSNFYSGSWYFDGSGDTLTVPNNTDFNFGSGDSTIEMWVYPTRISGTQENLITRGTSGYSGFIMSVTNFLDTVNGSSWGVNITYDNPLIANAWQHIAVCRSGNTWTVYINGIANGSATASGSVQTGAQTLTIGQRTGQTDFQGYMSDIHIYKGAAKYTSDFIPASTFPDILPDTPSGVSLSSGITKVTDGGSISFGSAQSDYLYLDSSGSGLTLTNNFSMEFFYNENGQRIAGAFITDGGGANSAASSNNGISFQFYHNAGVINLDWSNGGGQWGQLGSITMPTSIGWHHVVATNDASRTRIFIDGELVGSSTTYPTWGYANTSKKMYIGTMSAGPGTGTQGGYNSHGFMSDIRISNGSIPTEYQTSSTTNGTKIFDPPISSLTTTSQGANSSHVKLLCAQSQTSAGAADVAPTMGGVNSGTQWSAYASSNAAFSTTNTIQKAFDGNASTKVNTAANTGYSQTSNYDNAIEFVPPYPIPYSSSIKVIGRNTGQTTMGVKIDTGSGYGSEIALGNDNLQTVVSGSGNLVRMQVVTKTYSGENELGGIQIDGVYLTDPVSPNGNVAAINFNPFNTDIKTVRGQETGYATLNPLNLHNTADTLSEGNLKLTSSGSGVAHFSRSTISMSSGKYFCEVEWLDVGQNFCGIQGNGDINYNNSYIYLSNAKASDTNGSSEDASYGATWTTGDTIGVAYDADNKTLEFFKNGVSQGVAFTSITGTYDPNPTAYQFFFGNWSSQNATYVVNFGQKPFKFPPPAGFQPLNVASIRPETVIPRPNQYMNTVTYTGTGSDLTLDVGFKPDLSYFSVRSATGYIKYIFDSVRGATKYLATSHTQGDDAEGTSSSTLKSFNANGVTIGNNAQMNENSSNTWVSWHWKAGGDQPISDLVFGVNTDDNGFDTSGTSRSYNTTGFTFGSYTTPQSHPGGTYGANSAQIYKSSSGKVVKWSVSTSTADKYIWTSDDGTNWSSTGSQYDTDGSAQIVISKQIALSGGANAASLTVTGSHAFNVDDVGYASAAAAGLTGGNITPTGASVGTKQGFSSIKYTGNGNNSAQGIPHGLGKTPSFVMTKALEATGDVMNWRCYHQSLGATKYIQLNTSDAAGTFTDWANTSPTSQYFYVGGTNNTQPANEPKDYISYMWTDVPGLQKFGSYSSNNSTDGPFIELGFRPALILIKESGASGQSWNICDTSRNSSNPANKVIALNSNAAEYSYTTFDILSNGFKIRTNDNGWNGSSSTFIYAAWAEAPVSNLYGGQSNAR